MTDAATELDEPEEVQAAPVRLSFESSDAEKQRCLALRQALGNTGQLGYSPIAYALFPDGKGHYIAMELRKVRFEDCAPADPASVLKVPTLEHREDALRRLVKGAERRTRCMHHAGWDSASKRRRKGLK